jgi:hypothetical protein
MSYQILKDLYDAIKGDSSITALVTAGNIKVGWQNEFATYPAISIIQVGGNAVGRLGYKHASGQIDENYGTQIEIYSQKSLKENYDILDPLSKTMISANYEKLSDVDMWDDDLSAHRKITRWNKRKIYTK